MSDDIKARLAESIARAAAENEARAARPGAKIAGFSSFVPGITRHPYADSISVDYVIGGAPAGPPPDSVEAVSARLRARRVKGGGA